MFGKNHGWQAGTTLQLTPHVSLDVGYTSDNNHSSELWLCYNIHWVYRSLLGMVVRQ